MKMLMAVLLLITAVFSSCTKEAPAIAKAVRNKVIVVTGTFSDEKQNTSAEITKGTDVRYGDWSYSHFHDSLPSTIDITFTDGFTEENSVTGALTLNTKLSGAKKEDFGDGTFKYSGTGSWYVTKSTGTLVDFMSAGAGTLTYYVIDYPQTDQPYSSAYHVELQGFTPR